MAPMIPQIAASVGRGGKNLPRDVEMVQILLNDHRPPPLRQLNVDGKIGPETIAAIEEFQIRAVQPLRPDGRVDPHGATWNALLRAAATPAPAPAPQNVAPITLVFQHSGMQPTGVT